MCALTHKWVLLFPPRAGGENDAHFGAESYKLKEIRVYIQFPDREEIVLRAGKAIGNDCDVMRMFVKNLLVQCAAGSFSKEVFTLLMAHMTKSAIYLKTGFVMSEEEYIAKVRRLQRCVPMIIREFVPDTVSKEICDKYAEVCPTIF